MTNVPELGYWDIRGLAEPIRLLLKYTGIEFVDKTYSAGPAPDFDLSDWLNVKETLGLDFPNLPYYIDGDVKLSQSNTILRYISDKTNMGGSTPEEKLKVSEMQDVSYDLRWGAIKLFYYSTKDNYEERKAHYFSKTFPDLCGRYEKVLNKHKWFAGDKLTFPDFAFFELLDAHERCVPTCLDPYPKVRAFLQAVRELEPLREYLASPEFQTKPINNTMAQFR